jgi:hypothetical protein
LRLRVAVVDTTVPGTYPRAEAEPGSPNAPLQLETGQLPDQ